MLRRIKAIKDSLHRNFIDVFRHHHYFLHTVLMDIGLYPGQPPLLFILNKEDGLSQKELASRLQVKPATLTVMLKRMEKTELVIRKQDEEDQRVSRVYITEKGQEVFKMAEELMKKVDDQMFKGFTGEEKEKLGIFLNRIKDNLVIPGDNNKRC